MLECDVKEFFNGVGGAPAITGRSQVVATTDGVAIIEAMLKSKTPALRRTAIEIAEKLAET